MSVEGFREPVRGLFNVILRRLASVFGQDLPSAVGEAPAFTESSVLAPQGLVSKVQWDLLGRVVGECTSTEEYRAVLEYIETDPELENWIYMGRSVDAGADYAREWLLKFGPLQYFAQHYLRQLGRVAWDEPIFESQFNDFVRFLKAEFIDVEVLAPLVNFSAAGLEELRFDSSLSIRRLTSGDKTRAWEAHSDFLYVRPEHLAGWTHAISLRLQVEKSSIFDPEDAERIQHVLTVLRLHKQGYVGGSVGWVQPSQRTFMRVRTVFTNRFPALPLNVNVPPFYLLPPKDVDPVKELLVRYEAASHVGAFRLAIRRFHSAYERMVLEDQLIDYWVGLEALFAPDGKHGDLAFRASLRIANVLFSDGATRRECFRSLKRSYNFRSKVAHGSSLKPKEQNELPDVVAKTEELLRMALREWLREDFPRSPEEMTDQLLD